MVIMSVINIVLSGINFYKYGEIGWGMAAIAWVVVFAYTTGEWLNSRY